MDGIRRLLAGPWLPPTAGKAPYLWLLLLHFFAWKYFYIRPSVLELAMLALTVIAFVPLYCSSFWLRNRRLVPVLLVTFALGVAWAPFNFGACSFFIFASGMCAGIENRRYAYGTIALILCGATLIALSVELPLSFLLPTLAVGTPVGMASVMDATLKRKQRQLLRKQEEVEHLARIAERERISRDMHDLLGHTLSLITLKAELAGRLLDRDAEASRREIKDIEDNARQALAEVRSAVSGYRQTGFAHELAQARAALAAANVTLDAHIQAFAMPATAESILSLSLREAVTNILRHADATHCEVRVTLQDGEVVCHIRDDGRKLGSLQALEQGNGLRGMQERVASLGGQLRVDVARGLSLELRLPTGGIA